MYIYLISSSVLEKQVAHITKILDIIMIIKIEIKERVFYIQVLFVEAQKNVLKRTNLLTVVKIYSAGIDGIEKFLYSLSIISETCLNGIITFKNNCDFFCILK